MRVTTFSCTEDAHVQEVDLGFSSKRERNTTVPESSRKNIMYVHYFIRPSRNDVLFPVVFSKALRCNFSFTNLQARTPSAPSHVC